MGSLARATVRPVPQRFPPQLPCLVQGEPLFMVGSTCRAYYSVAQRTQKQKVNLLGPLLKIDQTRKTKRLKGRLWATESILTRARVRHFPNYWVSIPLSGKEANSNTLLIFKNRVTAAHRITCMHILHIRAMCQTRVPRKHIFLLGSLTKTSPMQLPCNASQRNCK